MLLPDLREEHFFLGFSRSLNLRMQAEIEQLHSKKLDMEDDLQKLRSENFELRSPKLDTEKETKEAKEGRTSATSSQLQRGVTAALVRQHQNLREMDADQILKNFDLDEEKDVKRLFKETDMRRLIRTANTTVSETDEEREARRKRMSRTEVLAEWLQSNSYEMIMALCL